MKTVSIHTSSLLIYALICSIVILYNKSVSKYAKERQGSNAYEVYCVPVSLYVI